MKLSFKEWQRRMGFVVETTWPPKDKPPPQQPLDAVYEFNQPTEEEARKNRA